MTENSRDTTDSGAVVRVVIADDHPTFRRGLAALLASVPDIDLVGAYVEEALEELLVAAGRPPSSPGRTSRPRSSAQESTVG